MLFIITIAIISCIISFCLGAKYANKKSIDRGYVIYNKKWYQISKRRW